MTSTNDADSRERRTFELLGHLTTLSLAALLVQMVVLARFGPGDMMLARAVLGLFGGALFCGLIAMALCARGPGRVFRLLRGAAYLLFAAGVLALIASAGPLLRRETDEAPPSEAAARAFRSKAADSEAPPAGDLPALEIEFSNPCRAPAEPERDADQPALQPC